MTRPAVPPLLLTLWLLSLPHPIVAQASHSYTVDRWNVDQGLPNNDIPALLQSRDGYLWVGSWAGAVRFDGVQFTPIAAELPNDHTRLLFEDHDGAMWVGVSGYGLVRLRESGYDSFTPDNGFPGRDPRAMAQDREGRIWAGTELGLAVIERGRSQSVAFNGLVSAIAEGRDGGIRIASATEVCDAEPATLRCAPPRGVTGRIAALVHAQDGTWWIGTDRGLFAGATLRLSGHVTVLREGRDGSIWTGFADGSVARLGPNGVERYGASEGLPMRGAVAAMIEDRERSVWFTTSNGGLSRLRPKRVTTYSTADGLQAPVIGSIVEDASGTIWAGTPCAGVAKLVGTRFVPQFARDLAGGCARSLLAARDGSLWIAGRGGGVWHWDGSTMHRYRQANGLSDDFATVLFEDRDGRIWIGTETGGLHIVERGRLSRAYAEADGVATHHLSSFAQDREGRIWIGSNGNGLSVYEQGAFHMLPPDQSPPSRNISGLLVDSRGDLWIATAADGLFRRRNGRYEAFGPQQGLGDRLVALMIEDRDDNLWVGTARGIARLERDRIEALAAGERTSLDPIVLDRSDGLIEVEGSGGGFDPSGLRDRHGRLWFSTIDGIVMVDPALFSVNRVVPAVTVEHATLDGDSITVNGDNAIHVAAGTAAIEVSYTAFSLVNPSKVRFRYRLVGVHDEWIDVGNRRTAYFSTLRPGDYTFEVKAANNDGLWNDAPAQLRLHVAPFVWERLEVQVAGVLLLLVATGAGAHRAAQTRQRRRVAELEREQALTRERTRIARDLHDDLGARLAQIALMADDAGTEAPGRIAGVAREAMQTMDELVWTVNARNDTVESFAAYAAEFVEEHLGIAGLRYRLQIDQDLQGELAADTRRHVFLAFKEAVHNVVKHGAATEVHVSLAVSGGELRLEVSDNGRGLSEAAKQGLGNGMRNMRERLEACGGTVTVGASAQGGTSVLFRLPLPAHT